MKKYSLRQKILAGLLALATGQYAILAYAQTRINLNQLQQQATNTVLGNFGAGTGNVTAQNIASCTSAASALKWTTNTGFGCNTAIDAATLGSATFAAPGAIGGGTPSSGAFTTLSATGQITSTLPAGTPPFVIASTTNVPNLNASTLSGATFAAPGAIGGGTPGSGAFTTLSATGQITSTLANGTAPFAITSSTVSPNLNAALLNGATFAAPGAIGGGTPASGSFTTLSASSAVNITGQTTVGTAGTSSNLVIYGTAGSTSLNIIRQADTTQSGGIDAGGGRVKFTSRSSASAVHPNFEFSSTNNATTNTPLTINGNSQIITMAGYGAGTATFDASGNISSVSDIRLKENIRPFTTGIEAIKQLNPILYSYTKESGLDQTKLDYPGFSAQNIQAVIPEAIGTNKAGYLGYSDRGVIAALVNAVKTQQTQIDALIAATPGYVAPIAQYCVWKYCVNIASNEAN